MNIYVKDEEMPKSCQQCELFSDFQGRCRLVRGLAVLPVPRFAYYRNRSKHCPLKPASELNNSSDGLQRSEDI